MKRLDQLKPYDGMVKIQQNCSYKTKLIQRDTTLLAQPPQLFFYLVWWSALEKKNYAKFSTACYVTYRTLKCGKLHFLTDQPFTSSVDFLSILTGINQSMKPKQRESI